MNGYAAYAKTQNITQSPRDVEQRLLGQVTAALIEAEENPKLFEKKTEAVLWNRSVWAAFRVDLADPDNALPRELKAQLISLSIWVDRESFDVLDGKADLSALIEVNKHIIDGLRGESGE